MPPPPPCCISESYKRGAVQPHPDLQFQEGASFQDINSDYIYILLCVCLYLAQFVDFLIEREGVQSGIIGLGGGGMKGEGSKGDERDLGGE
jgi:hypothetical protein